jgi:hypothetical protein
MAGVIRAGLYVGTGVVIKDAEVIRYFGGSERACSRLAGTNQCSTRAAPLLFASRVHSIEANSNDDLPHAQFVPITPGNCGHSRLIMVSLFLCI